MLVLFACAAAIPQQKPAAPALDHLCSIQFDPDGDISPESAGCLKFLASTIKVSAGAQLLLTGSAPHIAAIKSYLIAHESVPTSDLRMSISASDSDTVQTALVKPLPPPAPPVMAMERATVAFPAVGAEPPAPPPVGAERPATRNFGAEAPAPHAISPMAAKSAPTLASNPYSLGEEAAAWKASLKNGAVEYNVPPVMIAHQASTVTVIVHGYKDPNPHVLTQAAGTYNATLKVSDTMQVDLIGSPTEFTITPQATQPAQFVPLDGYATWIWSVTPINKASSQQLTIKVSLIPDASSGLPAQPLAEKPYIVDVNVESLWSVLSDRWHQDPMKAIEYILPGGAGWAAIGTILTTLGVGTWLRNKLNKQASSASAANQNATPAV
jgi:hypothetical protein